MGSSLKSAAATVSPSSDPNDDDKLVLESTARQWELDTRVTVCAGLPNQSNEGGLAAIMPHNGSTVYFGFMEGFVDGGYKTQLLQMHQVQMLHNSACFASWAPIWKPQSCMDQLFTLSSHDGQS